MSESGESNAIEGIGKIRVDTANRTERRDRIGIKAGLRTYPLDEGKKDRVSDAAGSVGEVEPDFDAAEVGAFGADGGGDAGAEMARRSDMAGELRMDFAELGNFIH